MANLRWKVLLILAVVVVFCAVGVYPIVANRYGITKPGWLVNRGLKLGLDLKGGVHLVLRVETDAALRVETESEMERLREQLTTNGVTYGNLAVVSSTEFRVEGINPAQDAQLRDSAAATGVDVNFDRSPGANGTYSFRMKPNVQVALRDEAVVQARQTIERRVNELGVAEPSISQQGIDQILVQLPGVSDVDRAKGIIGSPGL